MSLRAALPLTLTLDAAAGVQQGLYAALRTAILTRRLRAGDRLPPSRELARQYGLARGTVVSVYEQLAAEGYVEGRTGAGTFVRAELPDELLTTAPGDAPAATAPPAVSELALSAPRPPQRPCRAHQPALDQFPLALWQRVSVEACRDLSPALLGDADPQGLLSLREALAHYLVSARGLHCSAGQIFVVSGTQQALDLVARVLLRPGDAVAVENPGYPGARLLLAAQGLTLQGVPVDCEGLDTDALARLPVTPRMVHVTPAHQAPTGASLSLRRRHALRDWARAQSAWIFEDDYDSEYRYAGRPLPALQGLDAEAVVLHAGSFSKTLFPALRLGYLVVPTALVPAFRRTRALLDRFPPLHSQRVLARFITDGHYARHLRRMRALYAERRTALLAAVEQELSGLLTLAPHEAGLETAAWLASGLDEARVVAAARADGMALEPLAPYWLDAPQRAGVLLGFGSASPRMLRAAMRRLRRVLDALVPAAEAVAA